MLAIVALAFTKRPERRPHLSFLLWQARKNRSSVMAKERLNLN
ncbi:hypothetical protein [Pasteurella sp. 19428wF3_WM03]